jgi:hypothetical protein
MVAWSPDGNRIATTAGDRVVRLWDATTGRHLRTFDKFPLPPTGTPGYQPIAWCPDNRNLWVARGSHVVQIDTETGYVSRPESFGNNDTIQGVELAADGERLLASGNYGRAYFRDRDGSRKLLGPSLGITVQWHSDARRFLGNESFIFGVRGFDTRLGHRLGTLWPTISGKHWICVGPDGHWRGSVGAESQIVYVAMLEDGSQRTYTQAEFEKAFGWKNDPTKGRLLKLAP